MLICLTSSRRFRAGSLKSVVGVLALMAALSTGPVRAVEGGTRGSGRASLSGTTVFVISQTRQGTTLNRSYCSGVLVALTRVLTAAHCVQGGEVAEVIVQDARGRASRHSVRRVVLTGGPVGPTVRPVGASLSDLQTDVAILQLAEPASASRAAAAPTPAGVVPVRLRLAGRGLSGNSFGNVRSVELVAINASGRLVIAQALDGSVCKGDSGAPVFADVPGPPRLVGVASAVLTHDGRCGTVVLIARARSD